MVDEACCIILTSAELARRYIGVKLNSENTLHKWYARIVVGNTGIYKLISLGYWATEERAAQAYDVAVLALKVSIAQRSGKMAH